MADGGLTVLDGTQLRNIDLRLPETNGTVNGAQLLEIAEAEASSSLFSISLPETLKSEALKRIDINVTTELDRDQASLKLREYVTAIADELKDDPIIISVLDGSPLVLFLEDEDDFAMLAENLFTELDVEDKGKIGKKEIRNALVQMGVEMGVPPFSEFSSLNDILSKHGAAGDEELGQAQFAELLQLVLQDLADALAKKNIVIVQTNIKIVNGSKLRKLLADEKHLIDVVEKIYPDMNDSKDGRGCGEIVREFLEKNGLKFGLPPSEANDAVALIYDQIFGDVENKSELSSRDDFVVLVKDILEKFVKQLDANPVLVDLGR